jgi:hypothetical protein
MTLELSTSRASSLRGEGNEFAELIFVSFDDLFPLDLLAGAGVVRPKRNPSCWPSLILLALVETRIKFRRRRAF